MTTDKDKDKDKEDSTNIKAVDDNIKPNNNISNISNTNISTISKKKKKPFKQSSMSDEEFMNLIENHNSQIKLPHIQISHNNDNDKYVKMELINKIAHEYINNDVLQIIQKQKSKNNFYFLNTIILFHLF